MTLDRRQLLSGLGALTGAAALSSCSGFTKSGSTSSAALSFTTWGTDSELSGFRTAIKAFERSKPGARVRLNAVPFEQMFTDIDAQLQSDTAPDVFRVDYDNLGTYAGREQLLDLSSLLDPAVGPTFTEAMWRAVQFEGRPYGVPHHTDTSVILYNKKALADAGVDSVPTTLDGAWTWDEFQRVSLQLRRSLPKGRYPFAYNWQSQGVTRWLSWLFEANGRFLDPTLRKPAIDSAAGRAAVDFTKGFFTQDLVPRSSSIKSSTYASDLFFSETIAMVFGGAFLLPDAARLAKFEWGATYSPRDKRAGGDLGGNALVATAQSKKGKLAAEFLTFMTQRRTMRDFCVTSSLLPTRKDLVAEGIEFTVRPELSRYFVGQATTVRRSDAAQIASPSMAGINTVLGEQLEKAFVGGQSTQDTIDGMTAGITRALER